MLRIIVLRWNAERGNALRPDPYSGADANELLKAM
jgi:hypothetical protein